jgi:hypothetical protein
MNYSGNHRTTARTILTRNNFKEALNLAPYLDLPLSSARASTGYSIAPHLSTFAITLPIL